MSKAKKSGGRAAKTKTKAKTSKVRPAGKSSRRAAGVKAKTGRAKPGAARGKRSAAAKAPEKANGISSAAVKKATGRGWDGWFEVLDGFDVRRHGHTAAAEHIYSEYKCPGWWCQMVVVGYEQARGLRQKHEKPDGFEIGVSRTLGAPIERVFAAFVDDVQRAKWLPEKAVVHKATPHKSARMTWTDGRKVIAVNFYAKGEGRAQVAVQHAKLKDSKEAAKMKALWKERLEGLAEVVGG